MISSFLPKPRFTSFLVTLFLTLQLSACGTEDIFTAIAPEIGTDTDKGAETNNAAKISGIDRGSVIEDVDPDGNNLLEVGGKLNIKIGRASCRERV